MAYGSNPKKCGRSAVTNGRRLLPTGTGDCRRLHARRWRDVFREFKSALGHEPSLSETALLKTAANLVLSAELAAVELSNGRRPDHDELTKASGALGRILARLGLVDDLGVPAQARRAAKGGTDTGDIGDLLGV